MSGVGGVSGADPGFLIALGTFALILCVVLGVYWALLVRPEAAARATLQKRLVVDGPTRAGRLRLMIDVQRLSSVGPLNSLLQRTAHITKPLERKIAQAGMKTTVGVILLASGCVGMLALVLVQRQFHKPWVALAAGAFAASLPYLFVNWKKNKRMGVFEEQFPEAVDLIARTLRAGHAFPTGLKLAAEELPDPVGAEFKLLHDRQNYGLPLADALKSFAQRVPILDARFFVTAVLTQHESGGNLAEVLDNLAGVIRDRFQVKRQVRTLSAHGRMTGAILAGMPPAMACLIFYIAPGQLTALVTDPMGVQMIIGAIALEIIGAFVITKITNIEY